MFSINTYDRRTLITLKNFLFQLYLEADTQEERIRLLTALCRFDDETIQRQALEYIWNEV